MRCIECDYQLWNLASHKCPECSTAFKPSDYRFPPRQVKFRCPHCEHAYLGTSKKGHLVPEKFRCVTCQNKISMDDMTLEPVGQYTQGQHDIPLNPWLHRKEIGRVKSFKRTLYMSHFEPERLIQGTPTNSGFYDAFLFALIIMAIAVTGCVLSDYFLSVGLVGKTSQFALWKSMATSFVLLLSSGLSILLTMSVLMHLYLMITGVVEKSLDTTFKAAAYCTGPLIWFVIPFAGLGFGINGILWFILTTTFAQASIQKAHLGRVTAGQLIVAGGIFMLVRHIILQL